MTGLGPIRTVAGWIDGERVICGHTSRAVQRGFVALVAVCVVFAPLTGVLVPVAADSETGPCAEPEGHDALVEAWDQRNLTTERVTRTVGDRTVTGELVYITNRYGDVSKPVEPGARGTTCAEYSVSGPEDPPVDVRSVVGYADGTVLDVSYSVRSEDDELPSNLRFEVPEDTEKGALVWTFYAFDRYEDGGTSDQQARQRFRQEAENGELLNGKATVLGRFGPEEVAAARDLRSIAYGQTKGGYVDANDSFNASLVGGHNFEPVTFTGQAGDVVEIDPQARADGRVMWTRLSGPTGKLDRLESHPGRFRLPESGEYTITVGFLGSAPGNYTLGLERVGGERPAVVFDTAGDPAVDRSVEFTATVAGEESAASYEWRFGDGTTATGRTVEHTFASTGDYEVEVVATDAEGDTGNATATVHVESAAEHRYDDDEDGLGLDDLDQALEDVEGEDADGNLTVEEARQLVEEHATERNLVPTASDEGGTDDDGESDETDEDGTTDSDSDGLPDDLEERGVSVLESQTSGESDLAESRPGDDPRIVRLDTDPDEADTDGDGVPDGEELGEKRALTTRTVGTEDEGTGGGQTYYVRNSDPTVGSSADGDGDGLPDGLEEAGIPILRATGTYQDQYAEEDANVTDLARDPGMVVRLDTDPNSADTDGDGITDRAELAGSFTLSELGDGNVPGVSLGEQVAIIREYGPQIEQYPNMTVYVLESDPTDPNTDDSGLADAKERKRGSNPRVAEYLSVSAFLPVVAEQGCDPGEGGDPATITDCTRDVDAGQNTVGLSVEEEWSGRDDDWDDVAWLSDIQEGKYQSGATYYLVAVQINADTQNVDRDVRDRVGVQFTGFSSSFVQIIGAGPSRSGVRDGYLFEPFREGSDGDMTAYLVVRSQNQIPGAESDNEQASADWVPFGALSMSVRVPDESSLARSDAPGYDVRSYETDRRFAVERALPKTSAGEARDMVAEGTKKFAKGVVSATFPATAGGIGASSFYALTAPGTEAILIAAEGACLFSGVGKAPDGPDDRVGAAVAGEGAVPAYLKQGTEDPRTAYSLTIHAAN